MKPKRKKKERDLVLVEWEDSFSRRGWTRVSELEGDVVPLLCRSVGWVIAKKNGVLVLAASISGDGDEFYENATCDIAIPLKCVRKVTKLKAPR